MKIILLLLMISALSNANEPEKIKAKDLVDKVGRSELQTETGTSEIKVENIMTEIKMQPLIIQKKDKPKIKKKVVKKKVVKKKVVKKKAVLKKELKLKDTKVEKNTKLEKVPKSNKTTSSFKLSQLKNNDKITIGKEKTYLIRRIKSKMIQYKFNFLIPKNSKGLRKIRTNVYAVIEAELFARDVKYLQENPLSQVIEEKKEVPKITDAILLKRKNVEEKLNKGKNINKEIQLHEIKSNDDIYIFGEVQLLLRKKNTSSGIDKYWLIDKVNTENISLTRISKNHYKAKGKYQTKK